MVDPLDIANANMPADSSGISPDVWRNLMQFGLATMSAGATPGITTAGALGQGGMAALEQARLNADARAKKELMAGQAAQAKLGVQQGLLDYNLKRSMIGLPPVNADNTGQLYAVGTQQGQSNQQSQGSGTNLTDSQINNAYSGYQNYLASLPPMVRQSMMFHNTGYGAMANAAADMWSRQNSPQIFSPGQTRYDPMTGTTIASPHMLEGVDATGAKRPAFITQPVQVNGAQVGGQNYSGMTGGDLVNPTVDQMAASLPKGATGSGNRQSGGGIVTSLGLANEEYLRKNASAFVDLGEDLSDKALNGKSANATMDQMVAEANSVGTNALSDVEAVVRKYKQALGSFVNKDGKPVDDEQLNSLISIEKDGGILLRNTLKSTYSRVTNLDMVSTGASLPNVNTPVGAMILNTSQLKAANDYNTAASLYMQKWRAENPNNFNSQDFRNDLNKKFTPDAFWLNHLPDDMRQSAYKKILQSPNGEQRFKNIMGQVRFIRNNGLDPNNYGGQ